MSSLQGVLGNKSTFFQLSFASIFVNLLSLALPFTMLQIYDRILPNQSYGTASVLAVGVTIAIFLEMVLRYTRSWLLASAAANFELNTTIDTVKTLFNGSYRQLNKLGSGKIFNGLSSIAGMRELRSGQAAVALLDFPFVLIFIGLVAYIGGVLVFIPLLVWAVVLLLVIAIGKQLSKATQALSVSDSQRSRMLIHVLSGLPSAKALSLESKLAADYRALNHQRLANQEQVDWLSVKLQELIQSASQATTLILVLVGSLFVLDGQLTTGALAACSILAGRAVAPLSAIISLRSRLVVAKTAMVQVDELLGVEAEPFTGANVYQSKLPPGPIQFDTVSLQQNAINISGLSLTIQTGELISVKSDPLSHAGAFLRLLVAFEQPDSGTIAIDGVPLLQHHVDEFRQSILHVPVWPTLFTGTLLNNMTMFRPELENEAMQIADTLGLTQTIAQLPSGYASQITENKPVLLNKGAIKLIALVRAIVQEPSVLLLDEPMVSLDLDGQNRLTKMLTALKGQMTVVVASHFDEVHQISDQVIELYGAANFNQSAGTGGKNDV